MKCCLMSMESQVLIFNIHIKSRALQHRCLIPAHGRQGQEVPETRWQASFAELLSSRLSERPWLTKDSGEL